MNVLEDLKRAQTKPDLAKLLKVDASFMTRILYHSGDLYTKCLIPKKSGGTRTLFCPHESLKGIQKRLATLLQECIEKNPNLNISTFAHGFTKGRGIISNAENHLNTKYILNIDFDSFFDQFNFGRVRAFFLKNKNFKLNDEIATLIAKIAVYKNLLPQGSPCSPIISNIITHSVDVRFVSLASRNSCYYTRYADDITISTRRSEFPCSIAKIENNTVILSESLKSIVIKSGFKVNDKKTRVQYADSRQDVTGLVVNKKIGIKSEYAKNVRAMCHSLFLTGTFKDKSGDCTLRRLEGKLNHIDHIDHYNNKRYNLNKSFKYDKCGLNKREMLKHHFLFFKHFYSTEKPLFLCEGKTDNVYIMSALKALVVKYPEMVWLDESNKKYEYKVSFFNYTKASRVFLDLSGGTGDIQHFIQYYEKSFLKFKSPISKHPVIIILDNDEGVKGIVSYLKNNHRHFIGVDVNTDIRTQQHVHLIHNLYLVVIPKCNQKETAIEDYFDADVLDTKLFNAKFNRDAKIDNDHEYCKNTFANCVIKPNYATINFENFTPLLDTLSLIIKTK
jgi:RNA-directed DNA polymerase